MIIRIKTVSTNVYMRPRQVRVVRVYDHRVPSGVLESTFTQKGGLLAGTGAGTYAEHAPGSAGQYLTVSSGSSTGLIWETPSIAINDASNFLINGGFDIAQRQTPGTLTNLTDNGYSADRWKITRENNHLQFQRADASGEGNLTSRYYGVFKKTTNAGKLFICQIVEGANSVPLRGKTVIFQAKIKFNSGDGTIRMALLELASAGTMDTIPNPLVTSWNADASDPTLGSNVATISVESNSIDDTWQSVSVSAAVPSDSKNVICAVWSDSDFTTNQELHIAEAGLFLGDTTLSWTPRLIAQEIALCQRFYTKSFVIDTAPAQAVGINNGDYMFTSPTAGASVKRSSTIYFPEYMRSTPTVTIYNPVNANAQIYDVNATQDCTSSSYQNVTARGFGVYGTGHASTAAGNRLSVHWTAEAEL